MSGLSRVTYYTIQNLKGKQSCLGASALSEGQQATDSHSEGRLEHNDSPGGHRSGRPYARPGLWIGGERSLGL